MSVLRTAGVEFLKKSSRNRSGKQVKIGGRTEIRVPVLLLSGVQYKQHPA